MKDTNMTVISVEDKGNLKNEIEREKYWLQILAALLACFASITDGLLLSWSSPFIIKISQDKIYYDITEDEASFFAVLPAVSMMFSCFLFGVIADKLGRKRTLMMAALPQMASWILKIFAKPLWMFYLARILAGFGSGCVFATLPIYLGEISSPQVRGITGSLPSSINFFGQFLINLLGNFFSVKVVSYICLPIPVVFLILFSFMPESPIFHLSKNDIEAARESLKVLKRKQNVDSDLELLKKGIERQLSERADWKDLILINSNRRALIAGIILRISQGFAGIPIYATSMQFVFAKSEGILTASTATIITTFTCFFTYIIAGTLVDKFGKRKSYMVSIFICSWFFLLIATYFYIEQYQTHLNLQNINWLPFVMMELCICFGSIGPGIVPTLMVGELFSAGIKAKAASVMVTVFALSLFASINVFFQMYNTTGLCGPFFLYGVCSLISVGACYFFIPETKGKTLEDIQQILKNGNFR